MPAEPAPPPPPPAASGASQKQFDIAEEYGTARKNLPPAGILAICLGIVAVIVAAYSLTHRAHAQSSGTIDDMVSVVVPGQDVIMVAINLSLHNNEDKPSWIHTIQATADVGGKQWSDDAAPAVDAQRYFQAFPELKQHALSLLTPEARINARGSVIGTIVVSFPVKAEDFANRKSLTVSVTPYNELPVVMTR